jgi:hypothetical protein
MELAGAIVFGMILAGIAMPRLRATNADNNTFTAFDNTN